MKSPEKQGVFVQAWLKGFWPADCWEPFRTITENGQPVTSHATTSDGIRNLQILAAEIESLEEDEDVDILYARNVFFRLRDHGDALLKRTLVRKPGGITVQQVTQAPTAVDPTDPANFPHSSDPQLKWLDSIDAYKNASVDKIRRYTQPAAFGEMTRDGSNKTLNERFNERVQFLQANKIRKSAEPSTNQTSGAPRDPNANAVLNEVLGNINVDVSESLTAFGGLGVGATAVVELSIHSSRIFADRKKQITCRIRTLH